MKMRLWRDVRKKAHPRRSHRRRSVCSNLQACRLTKRNEHAWLVILAWLRGSEGVGAEEGRYRPTLWTTSQTGRPRSFKKLAMLGLQETHQRIRRTPARLLQGSSCTIPARGLAKIPRQSRTRLSQKRSREENQPATCSSRRNRRHGSRRVESSRAALQR
jgi:hypothetical protein